MIGIYKITNLENNKVYIGQSVNITKRWTSHKTAAFNKKDKCYDYPLYAAMRKYSLQKFSFTVIEECTVSELNTKEKYWIAKYHSYLGWANSNGYNQTIGGDSDPKPFKLTYEIVTEIKRLLKLGQYTQPTIAKKFNISADLVRRINHGRCWRLDTEDYPLFNYTQDIASRLQTAEYHDSHPASCKKVKANKPVYPTKEAILQKLENYVPYKYSLTTIARELNITRRVLTRLLTKYNISINAHSEKLIKVVKKKTIIEQYSLDGKLLNQFNSTREAAKQVFNNENLCSPISACCKGKRKQFKKFIWKSQKI